MNFTEHYIAEVETEIKYPMIKNNMVDDLKVSNEIPNQDSIEATLTDYEILKGIRIVPLSDFDGPRSVFYAKNDFDKSRELAIAIKQSKEITPLIIVIDEDGPYILEGSHRYVALYNLGIKHLPAMIVIDKDIS